MNVRENTGIDLTGDFEVEVTIPPGTNGALRVVADGFTAQNSQFQIELGVVSGAAVARVRLDGVWTTL